MTYEDQLKLLVEQRDDIVVLTAENRAAMRNITGLLGKRFIDFGIAEQTMIGTAAGLALRGRIPICHALATFLTLRAFEFIRTDVGISGLPVKLVGAVAGFLSEANGPTHQALEDVAILRGIPNMRVLCPTDSEEQAEALAAMIDPHPAYMRFNAVARSFDHHTRFEIGKAELLREGEDVALLSYGFLVREVLKAAQLLEEDGVSARVISLRTLSPVDEEAILAAARETGFVVTVEDHFLTGGLFTIVSEVLTKHRTVCDVHPIALEQRWFKPALLEDVLTYERFTGAHLAQRVLRKVKEPQ
ncbi:MAG: transketolase [Ignavibacteria bacterium]